MPLPVSADRTLANYRNSRVSSRPDQEIKLCMALISDPSQATELLKHPYRLFLITKSCKLKNNKSFSLL